MFLEMVCSVINDVGVAQLQIIEIHCIPLEQRPGMPGPLVQLEELGSGNPEHADLGRIGRQIVVTSARLQRFPPLLTTLLRRSIHDRWLGHSEVPVLAADGAQALGHAGVVGDARELQRPVLQSHDVEPRDAAAEVELRVVGAELVAVGGGGDRR